MKNITDATSYNEYDHQLDKKLLLIISITGIIGAILTVIYRMIFPASFTELIVQLISIIVFGAAAVLALTKGWVRRLIPFVIAVAFAQLLVTWWAYTLADYMARILLIYVVVIVIILLKGKVRSILLSLLAIMVALMIYHDVSSFSARTITFDYWDLVVDSLIIGMMIILLIALYKAYLEKTKKKLYTYSMKDPLTGAYNIRYFTQQLNRFEERWHNKGNSYIVAIADVNDFKTINDIHGHQTGDSVLQLIVYELTRGIGKSGVVSRYGGDEFIILLKGDDKETASKTLTAILERISSNATRILRFGVTMSIGLCERKESDLIGDDIQRIADRRMYDAKAHIPHQSERTCEL